MAHPVAETLRNTSNRVFCWVASEIRGPTASRNWDGRQRTACRDTGDAAWLAEGLLATGADGPQPAARTAVTAVVAPIRQALLSLMPLGHSFTRPGCGYEAHCYAATATVG